MDDEAFGKVSPIIPDPTPPKPEPKPEFENFLVELHNEYRRKHGKTPMKANDKLMKAAQLHADWMQKNRKMSHSEGWFGPNIAKRISNQGYRANSYGENVAWGQKTESEVMAVWINSRPHRMNILGNFDHIGVGRAGNYWCCVFGSGG